MMKQRAAFTMLQLIVGREDEFISYSFRRHRPVANNIENLSTAFSFVSTNLRLVYFAVQAQPVRQQGINNVSRLVCVLQAMCRQTDSALFVVHAKSRKLQPSNSRNGRCS